MPLVARCANSMSVFVSPACGSAAVPLHRGQCAPHPSPERDARTYAPHRMTASVSAVTNHAKAAKRFGLCVVDCVRPAASMIEERERADYPAPTKTKANLNGGDKFLLQGATPGGGLALAAYERAQFGVGRGVECAHLKRRGGPGESSFEFVNRDFLLRRGACELRAFAGDENRETFDEPERRAPVAERVERGVCELVAQSRREHAAAAQNFERLKLYPAPAGRCRDPRGLSGCADEVARRLVYENLRDRNRRAERRALQTARHVCARRLK